MQLAQDDVRPSPPRFTYETVPTGSMTTRAPRLALTAIASALSLSTGGERLTLPAECRHAPVPSAPAALQRIQWRAPRKAADMVLRPLWRSHALVSFPPILYPADVQFAARGLLIYDFGEKHLHVVDAASGRPRLVVGRRGPGPAELGDRPVWLFGTFNRPRGVEFSDGRISTLVDDKLLNIPVSREGRWAMGCSWGANSVLLQTSVRENRDYIVSTTGEGARVVDSVAAPWQRYRDLTFMVRQGRLGQIDDSTCALLPLYQREFALIAPGRAPRLGMHVEVLPEAKSVEVRTKTGGSSSMAKGSKRGALDASGWRDRLLVLFQGTPPQRLRFLDSYDRETLAYLGSTLLPFDASKFAIHGDTMVVVVEVNDEPVVGAFLLAPSRTNQPPR